MSQRKYIEQNKRVKERLRYNRGGRSEYIGGSVDSVSGLETRCDGFSDKLPSSILGRKGEFGFDDDISSGRDRDSRCEGD